VYESTSGTDNPALARRIAGLLASGRAGLVTDIDGTISPIVAVPADASVLPRARQALAGLRDVLALVGVVSGRRVTDARKMVDLNGLVYVGNHGFEMLETSDAEPGRAVEIVTEALPWVPRLAAALDDMQRHLSQPGILIENKGATASLHYRLAPDLVAARAEILDLARRLALPVGFQIEEGRKVLNLLPPLTISKGTALIHLARRHALQRLVYIGDDVTDAHAFKALAIMAQSGELQTLSVGVVGGETPRSVSQIADAWVASEDAAAELLWAVLNLLEPSATMQTHSHGQGRALSFDLETFRRTNPRRQR
jgi:trehalose 6-phosphate phosphatase